MSQTSLIGVRWPLTCSFAHVSRLRGPGRVHLSPSACRSPSHMKTGEGLIVGTRRASARCMYTASLNSPCKWSDSFRRFTKKLGKYFPENLLSLADLDPQYDFYTAKHWIPLCIWPAARPGLAAPAHCGKEFHSFAPAPKQGFPRINTFLCLQVYLWDIGRSKYKALPCEARNTTCSLLTLFTLEEGTVLLEYVNIGFANRDNKTTFLHHKVQANGI